jgi:dUTP pyrophosphatase
MQVMFKKLSDNAQLPTRAKQHSAGFDIHAPERVEIPAGQSHWVKSGVAMAIPDGYVGVIMARSSLAKKYSLIALGGVIDSDYRGEVQIGLHNLGSDTVEIKAGDRVCQMLVVPYCGESALVHTLLDDSDRGANGFGSTGR